MVLTGIRGFVKAALGVLHRSRAFGGPVRAAIELVGRCNICCLHCIYYSPELELPDFHAVRRARLEGRELGREAVDRERNQEDADSGGVLSCLDQLLSAGTRRFVLGGSGEPFLHKDITTFVSRIKRGGGHCAVSTNGTLLDRDTVDELIGLKLDSLMVTTMSGSAEKYVATHPGATHESFETVKRNLEYIAERKRALGVGKPRVSLVSIVIKQNVDAIFELAEFAARMSAERVEYRALRVGVDPALEKLAVDQRSQATLLSEQLEKARLLLESSGIEHNVELFRSMFTGTRDTSLIYDRIPCYAGWLNVLVSSEGDVYTCNSCVPVGNMFRQSFREIWNGKAYRAFRKAALSINRRKTPVRGCECHTCSHCHVNLMFHKILHPFASASIQRELAKEMQF